MATSVAVRDDLTQIFQTHLLLNFRLWGRTFVRRNAFQASDAVPDLGTRR